MKKLIQAFLFLFVATTLWAQDVIYTVSGDYNGGKTPLDSIIIDNITNGTSISFGELPEHDYYQINLTKGAYWGTVSVFDLEEPSNFVVQENTPGHLSVMYRGSSPTDVKISVVNVNGQNLYIKYDLSLHPQNSLLIKLGSAGVYFVKIESSKETKTFKAIGGITQTGYDVEINDVIKSKSASYPKLKSKTIVGEGDFAFEEGDSIRIWAFRKDIYAWPEHLIINESDEINFQFEDIIYSTEMLVAYPDSTGEVIKFTVNDDTLYCEKINEEYIHQGDIILTEEQINLDLLKGASITDLKKLWPDGIIYYTINDNVSSKDDVLEAIWFWNTNTSLDFKERGNEDNYIEFIHDDESTSSFLGMVGGKQEIRIQPMAHSGHIMHEIGHAIGLIHEHSRSDRDEDVDVYSYKIKYSKRHNYERYDRTWNNGDFDWNSIMLYDSNTFESWLILWFNNPVMVKNESGDSFKEQRSYLSRGDLKMVEELYGKNTSKRPFVTARHTINIEDNSIYLIGKLEDIRASDVLTKGIAWKKAGENEYYKVPVDEPSNEFSIKLAGIERDWLYYYYAYAENSYGSSTSEIISFWYEAEEAQSEKSGKFVDSRDTNEYNWVKIGDQVWMTENLAYLPKVNSLQEGSETDACYYVYNYNGSSIEVAKSMSNYKNYGVLYNWPAVMQGKSENNSIPSSVRGICPEGWHVPSYSEWDKLAQYISRMKGPFAEYYYSWDMVGYYLKSNTGWNNYGNESGNGIDSYGFKGLPGGYRIGGKGHSPAFYYLGEVGIWYTCSKPINNKNVIFNLRLRRSSELSHAQYEYEDQPDNAYSVRCIKDQ